MWPQSQVLGPPRGIGISLTSAKICNVLVSSRSQAAVPQDTGKAFHAHQMVSSSLPTMLQALANALIIFMTCVNTILTSFCTKRTHKWCCQIHPIILSNSSYDMALVPAAWSLGCLKSWCHTLGHGRLGLGIISDALVLLWINCQMPQSCG